MPSIINNFPFLNSQVTNPPNSNQKSAESADKSQYKAGIFCIAHDLPPLKTPIAVRANKILSQIQKTWHITVLTATKNATLAEGITINYAKNWYPKALITLLTKLKLEKLLTLLIWPDPDIFWFIPAVYKGYQIIKQQKPSAIFVFMMPYSAGLVGVFLKWLTGLPLVLNLDDSPTCTDMHPSSPSWLHHHLEHWLENFYIRQANAVVYVSQLNLETVQKRQPQKQQSKLHLIRCGADPVDFSTPINEQNQPNFQIIYTGGMNGWYEFYHLPEEKSLVKKLYQNWLKFGYYTRNIIDYSSSSPVYVGRAVKEVIAQYPDWEKRIKLEIYGNSFSEFVVEKVLQNQNLTDVVAISGTLPHFQAIQLARQADLLLITLPNRPDGSKGGRISCKTYEYLMTDRPILAAVPQGENWDYLQDKPGVWLVEPTDTTTMIQVIAEIAAAKFAGKPLRFNRSELQPELSYINLVQDYLKIFNQVCSASKINQLKL
ncbi:MAG TPA: glycosyltransferase [Nostocaceae cyanobacterium]|nr:glycosyltransferase [Nostocaceae cyanobacterium]